MSWWSRLVNVMRSDRLDTDLEEEQRFHIDARAADLEAQGLSREQALVEAARRFGAPLRARQSSRDVKLLRWHDAVVRDLRFGLRLLHKDAAVSSAAIVSLGLAIGACTAAFALIDALILRKLPVLEPERLVSIVRPGRGDDLRFSTMFSYLHFQRVRQSASAQMDVFSLSHQSLRQAILPDASDVEEKLRTQFVSGNALEALG